jgi:diguanylate cyclase (GGDEF)-like protein
MLGLAIILSRRLDPGNHAAVGKSAILVSQMAALLALAVALLAVIGHVYHAGAFVALDGARPMSMATAVCIVLLAAGTLLIEPGRGVVRYVTSEGPAGTMSRFLLPVSVLVPVGLGWLRVAGIRAGLFNAEFGIALSALLNVLMLFALTLLVARKLYQLDQKARLVETELLYRATHDSLTGLVNRPVFREQLLRRIKMARGRRKPNFAVFYLDLDGFKQVNDRFGHDAGDRLLVEVADILRSCTRASDTVARFGGDEFVILFEEIDGADDARMLADRIVRQVPQSFGEGERRISTGISIGVALNPGHPTTPDEMLREADLALYKAKINGKGCYRMSTPVSDDRYQMTEGDMRGG